MRKKHVKSKLPIETPLNLIIRRRDIPHGRAHLFLTLCLFVLLHHHERGRFFRRCCHFRERITLKVLSLSMIRSWLLLCRAPSYHTPKYVEWRLTLYIFSAWFLLGLNARKTTLAHIVKTHSHQNIIDVALDSESSPPSRAEESPPSPRRCYRQTIQTVAHMTRIHAASKENFLCLAPVVQTFRRFDNCYIVKRKKKQ